MNNNNIAHKWFFNQTPEQVWEYLVNPDLIEKWLMKNDFQPVQGHQFRFTARPMPQMNFDGIIYCTVMEVERPNKLVYTWKGGPGDGTINLDSIVTWTLSPKEGGTELELLHDGFKHMDTMMIIQAMNEGWQKNVNKIKALLENEGQPTVA